MEGRISRIFPMGGPENVIEDASLPFHPSNRFLSREQCNRASVADTIRSIENIERRIEDLDREIRVFRTTSNDEHTIYMDVVDTVPKNSVANIKIRNEAFYRYQQRSADATINIVRARFQQRRFHEQLLDLHTTLEAMQIGVYSINILTYSLSMQMYYMM